MSVDIGWEKITSGPDGAALAEKVRAFVHEKFQQITLPRFINAVHVHAFEFGSVCPEIEIKDICDPLPDFYEDEDEDVEEETPLEGNGLGPTNDSSQYDSTHEARESVSTYQQSHLIPQLAIPPSGSHFGKFDKPSFAKDSFSASANPFSVPFPRSTTPGIPGGTSNLSYFHFPGSGLSGTQTPLAAVASGTPFTPRPWSFDSSHQLPQHTAAHPGAEKGTLQQDLGHHDPSTRPSTANSISSPRESESGFSSSPLSHQKPHLGNANLHESILDSMTELSPTGDQSRQPSDMQVVTRVKYAGDVRMTLTAEILLDYPMPSFVGIPLKLTITGMNFDGVAIAAWVKKKMHFCFLDPEDAAALVGQDLTDLHHKEKRGRDGSAGMPGPLQEIHVESEIGRQADGKQVLKNVGKVEKFVLEQVRKIFEEEFVFPSYWTFLV